MRVKVWWKSRTIWLNVLAALLVALEAHLQLFQPLLPVSFYAVMAVALPAANLLVRLVTSAKVTLTAPPEIVR